ncbi:RNA-guided endonuclease InsQ/TnpB family protein [Streptomyces hirsutus]|uniref:RNA-guided endonuclease InsQ/TnpB family protein n=1 Tax=Streptomyces hirsutus TaxID=35620 RepID=UPI003643E825
MSWFRMYPTGERAGVMLGHCAHARYVWNLTVEQHAHWRKGRKSAPGFAEQCRQLTEARRSNAWLRAGNADVQQQALRDFARAKSARFTSGSGEPTWRKKFVHEGFRVIGTDRVPQFGPDGGAKVNAGTGRQVMGRSVVVRKLNRRWAQVKVPGCGWVRFRLTRRELPVAKTFRVTFRNDRWHIAFAVIPDPIDAPGVGEVIGIDRGVKITAALSDGRRLNCPQLTVRERAQVRKHQRRAARAPRGSEAKAAEYAKVARLQGPGGGPAQGLVREDLDDARPHLPSDPVREAEHHDHDSLGEGNRRAAGPERPPEGRAEPGGPRPGLGPAAPTDR